MSNIRTGIAAENFGPRHRWVILSVGAAAQISFAAAFSGLPVLSVLMRQEYGLAERQLGIVLGSMALGVAVSEVLWGLLTDKLGDRRVLLTGLVLMAAMLVLMSLFITPAVGAGFGPLALSYVVFGAVGASVNSSSGRAIMTWFSDGRRGFAMSIRQSAIPVGGALGALVLPVLAQRWGFGSVYVALAALCMVSAAATWLWLYEAPVAKRVAAQAGHVIEGHSPLRRMDVWRLASASALLTVPQVAVLTFAGIYLHDVHQLGVGVLSAVLITVQLIGGGLRIASGKLSDRFANRRRFIRGFGLLAGGATIGLALSSAAAAWWILLLLIVAGVFANAWHGVAFAEIAIMAGADRAGTAIGLEGMMVFASAFITPYLIAIGLSLTSWAWIWGLVGIMALSAVPLSPGSRPST